MLEGCADTRFIQAMLGHEQLSSTQLYTQVAIRKLKEIHTATHPAAKLTRKEHSQEDKGSGAEVDRAGLLAALDAEGDDERPDGG